MNPPLHPPPFCDSPTDRVTQLTKFAFLLSAALPEGSTTPVIGLNRHLELANCFVPSGIISCSSLSMRGNNSCSGGESSAAIQEQLAALNMNSPIYTSSSPDAVAYTSKSLLTNTVRTMEELMESRLSGIVLQLLNTANSSAGHTRVMVHLLSPSRNPIKICTVLTRFDSSQADDKDEPQEGQQQTVARMVFKAVLDVKIFGEVTTVELSAPVVFVGRFDDSAAATAAAFAVGTLAEQGPLLTSVDIKFDCVALLRDMISNARILVKAAVTEAAALSVKIGSIAGGAAPSIDAGGRGENFTAVDVGISGGAISGSAGMLAVALKLRREQQQQQQNPPQVTSASLQLGNPLALGSSPLDDASPLGLGSTVPTQDHVSTPNSASLSALLNSSSSNHLGSTATLSSHPLSSMLSLASFGSLASLGTIGTKNTFASLLKSSNSLNQLNAEWLLKRPRSNHILRRHLQNVGGAGGSGGSGSNANATFDFGSLPASGHAAQGQNFFQGFAGGGLNAYASSSVAKNPRFGNVSNDSIGDVVNISSVVRFKDPAPSPSTHEVAAAALGCVKLQDQTLNQTFLGKAEDMLLKSPRATGAAVHHKSQHDLLREMLLEKPGCAGRGAASDQLKSQGGLWRELLGTGLATSSACQADSLGSSLQTHHGQHKNRALSLHQPPRQPTPPPTPEAKPESATTTTNIHKGLFSWLEKDSMFLTEEKIKEQNRIHAKKEQESREAPMPLRFFSSAEEGNLERMGEVLFGGEKRKSGAVQGGTKKRKTHKAQST